MENVIKLYPSRTKWIGVLIGSVVFVAAGIFMVANPQLKSAGLASSIFFGLCAIVAVVNLLPEASWLMVEADGFTTCSLFRKSKILWSAVNGFSARRSVSFGKIQVAVEIVGSPIKGALPDTYGKSASDLADLMNSWRTRWMAANQSLKPTNPAQGDR